MTGTGILIMGVLVLAAVLVITAAIIAMAPYLAIIIVLLGLAWYFMRGTEPGPPMDTS
jgi:hypothetical protein